MRSLLSAAGKDVLARLARMDALLAFDFDGTLCPLVAQRRAARLAPGTRRLLAEVARLYPCIVVSGRSLADLRPRLAGIELAAVLGNHGIEPEHDRAALRRRVARWRNALAPRLAAHPGIELEDKRLSLAIHYRRTRQKRRARATIGAALSELDGARILGGKQVVNVLPESAPHKGDAVERERRRRGCRLALFLGDDETDEDVFAMKSPSLIATRVGRARSSAAPWYLASQRQIDALLNELAELRRPG